jgi:hypothetical protein
MSPLGIRKETVGSYLELTGAIILLSFGMSSLELFKSISCTNQRKKQNMKL